MFENLNTALKAVGGSFRNVVQLTTYMVDMTQIDAYREIRLEYLKENPEPPTSTLVGVSRLVQEGYLLEVEVIAVLP